MFCGGIDDSKDVRAHLPRGLVMHHHSRRGDAGTRDFRFRRVEIYHLADFEYFGRYFFDDVQGPPTLEEHHPVAQDQIIPKCFSKLSHQEVVGKVHFGRRGGKQTFEFGIGIKLDGMVILFRRQSYADQQFFSLQPPIFP